MKWFPDLSISGKTLGFRYVPHLVIVFSIKLGAGWISNVSVHLHFTSWGDFRRLRGYGPVGRIMDYTFNLEGDWMPHRIHRLKHEQRNSLLLAKGSLSNIADNSAPKVNLGGDCVNCSAASLEATRNTTWRLLQDGWWAIEFHIFTVEHCFEELAEISKTNLSSR